MSKRGGNDRPPISFSISNKLQKTSGRKTTPDPVEDPVESEIIDKIPKMFREISFKPAEVGRRRRLYGVTAYWDFENTQLPGDYRPSMLKKSINKALKRFHPDLYLHKLVAIGNTDQFKEDALDLFKEEFSITRVIPRERFCKQCNPIRAASGVRKTDEADSLLKEGMLFYGYDIRPPANILVITGDQDFASVISGLKKRGFTMLLAHPEKWNQELLGCAAHIYWKWLGLINGEENY